MADLREQLQSTLGANYTLEQELGGGGMSRVFVAHEVALGRKVVVKVLPPEMAAAVNIERFRREIQLAAQLQHPHIVPLLSAGETGGLPYFTMPFVRGESLRVRLSRGGELPISEAVRILREVASALAYAHENGVVHRDMKPENVLVSGGSAMVTDFGVAKAVSASSGTGGQSLTSLGVALGTPAYMAPEQATADPNTDHRADIYALGVMAYEMLGGSTPFPGRSPQATLAAHVTEQPESVARRRPALPPLLVSLVMACLEKRAADRPQSAHDVVHRLDALSTPSGGLAPTEALQATKRKTFTPQRAALVGGALAVVALIGFAASQASRTGSETVEVADVPAIAVLPFENRGREEGKEFTDGMTEEITNRLSSVRGLRVIGRQSAMVYAGSRKTPQEIARELGVQYILTGTVRWDRGSGGREMVRVSPALVRASDATQVWSDAYQTVLSGMFEVQSQVATQVATALNVALQAPERAALAAKPTENLEAYSHYLRGNELLYKGIDPSPYFEAVRAFERAVELDPDFALAYARLSYAHTELFWFHGDRSAERLARAKQTAERAVSLSPGLAEGHFALGLYHYHGFLEYDAALREFDKALRARPNDFETLFIRGAIHRRQGKWNAAIEDMTQAVELEPRMAAFLSDLAATHIVLNQFAEAERYADRALAVDPSFIDAARVKANVILLRDADVPRAVRVYEQVIGKSLGTEQGSHYALLAKWPAIVDPEIRSAAERVVWAPSMGEKGPFLMDKARLYLILRDEARAQAYADTALRLLSQHLRQRPRDAELHAAIGEAQAVLGRPEALQSVDRALQLRPLSKDAFAGPDLLRSRAFILMRLGRTDEALRQIEELLKIPNGLTSNYIRLHPMFDPLRTHPKFQRLTVV